MKELFSKIISFIKGICSNDINIQNDKSKLNDIKKNKNCNINIINNGVERHNEQK